MDESLRKTLLAGAPALLLAVAVSTGLSLWQLPEDVLISTMRGQWVLNDVVIRLIDVLIPLTMTVFAVVFSLLLNPAHISTGRGTMPGFFRLAHHVLIFIIIGTVGYGIILGVLRPLAVSARQRAEADSVIASELLERGRSYVEEERHSDAVRSFESYLALNPEAEDVTQELAQARAAIRAVTEDQSVTEDEGFTPAQAVRDLSVGELIQRARGFLEDEDFFSAHYYAGQALDLDPSSPQAQQIAARARAALQRPASSEEEEAQAEFFRRKRDGYLALYEQDDPISAYYIFKGLQDEQPRDPDVERYYAEALERVQDVTFFVDDAQENVNLPGSHDILLTFRENEDTQAHLWIGKTVQATSGTYLYDIEAIGLRDGTTRYHFLADYGKMVGDILNMSGIDRDVPQRRAVPRYVAGSREDGEENLLQIPYSMDAMLQASYAGIGMEEAGILQLLDMRSSYPELGHRVEPVYRELLQRLTMPFAFVVLSILSVALGWKWRSRSLARPSIFVIAMAPLIFLPAHWLASLYEYLHDGLTTLLVATTEPLTATILLLVVETLVLVMALVVFAGQKTR
ncbi:MAG: hypothetical protein ACLFO1_07745 [Spirochaetaceae bacterium]